MHVFSVGLMLFGLMAGPGDGRIVKPAAPARDGPASVQSADTVRVAALRRWPPYYRWPEGDEPTGFAVETFRDIADRAGLVPEFRRFSTFPEAIRALRSGRIDVIPNLGDVPKRREWAAFTTPVQTFPVVVFTRTSGPTPSRLSELSGRAVGVVRENVGAEIVADRPSIAREVYQNAEAALFALLAGEVDAVVYPRPIFLALAREIGASDDLRAADRPLREVKRAIAVSPEADALRARLDAAVSGYVGSPTYEERYRNWFGRTEPFWTAERVAWSAGGVLLLVILVLSGWRYRSVRRLNRRLQQSEQRYEQMLTEITDVVTILDRDGTIRYESPSIEHVFGYGPDELVGTSAVELTHPDDRDEVAASFSAAVEGDPGGEQVIRYRFRHADGSWRHVESVGVVARDETLGFLVVTRDITDRIQAQEKFRAIFETTPLAVVVTALEEESEGEIVEVNPAFEELLGYPREDAVGTTVGELNIWVRPERRQVGLTRLRETGTVRNFEAEFKDADGNRLDVLVSSSILELGGRRFIVGMAQDISERKAFEQELERQALHDPLTGLPNRTLLSDRIEQGVARARREDEPLGLLMLDINQFKRINDRLGHSAGDRVIVEFADRLDNTVREEDTVARWGGDEFFVVLPGLEEADRITDIPERLRAALRAPFEVGAESVHLGITVGAVVYSEAERRQAVQTDDPEELVRFASLALHWARESPEGFRMFEPDVEEEGSALIRRERELHEALEEGRIVPYYQPVVDLSDGTLIGIEALARWRHPERGIMPPSEFIPLAEEIGLIGRVGEAVIRRGCRDAGEWHRSSSAGGTPPIAFNLSGQQFGDPKLVRKLERWIADGGLRPEAVTLEVTETSLMQVPSRLDDLRKAGFQIYVDDFGTGYSTFTYLRELEVDGLKVDMSFVQNITESTSDVALVETMLTLGRRLSLEVVAEGIETEAQRRKLQSLGFDKGQGFLFGRPVPAEAIASRWNEVAAPGE